MDTLALKIVLTPLLIGAASLAARRIGPAAGGWLVALPWTTGPFLLFVALEQGSAFAATAAVGSLLAIVSEVAFALAYAVISSRAGWPGSLAAAVTDYALCTLALNAVPSIGPLIALPAAALGLAIGGAALRPERVSALGVSAPAWDLPARMVVATTLVVATTGAAAALGPRLAGLITPFPVYALVLTVFAHQHRGPHAARATLRGFILGLISTALSFMALALLLETAGIGPAFSVAFGVAIAVQALTFTTIRR